MPRLADGLSSRLRTCRDLADVPDVEAPRPVAVPCGRVGEHRSAGAREESDKPDWLACRSGGGSVLLSVGGAQYLSEFELPSQPWLGVRRRCGGAVAEFACARAVRVGPGCHVCHHRSARRRAGRLVAGRPQDRRASSLRRHCWGLLGAALMLAAFPVDVPMLTGGQPETWNGWMHGIAFLLIIATGVPSPLAMALAVRRDASWRPITLVSLAAAVLFVVFCSCPGATPHS